MSQDNQQVPPDPIYNQSLSIPIVIAALALLVSVAFAVYDEAYRRRPYKAYQKEFHELYGKHLERLEGTRANVEAKIREMGEFQELEEAVTDATEAAADELAAADAESKRVSTRLRAVNEALKDPRSRIAATNWKAEHAAEGDGEIRVQASEAAQDYLQQIRDIREEVLDVAWTIDGERNTDSGTVTELEALAMELIGRKAELQKRIGALTAPASEARKARDEWLADNMADLSVVLSEVEDDDLRSRLIARVREVGAERYLSKYETTLSAGQIKQLKTANDAVHTDPILGGQIKEIFIREANWVDRCETCHMGMRSPVPIQPEDVEGKELFKSHPRPELLATHDPERFGCSMCHGGNGVAITSIEYAHGLDHHWLHRLHPEGAYAAGCVQCHDGDIHLDDSPLFNRAKGKFREKGCWGCHPRAGFAEEGKQLNEIQQAIGELDAQIAERQRLSTNLRAVVDPLYDDDEALADQMLADLQPRLAGLVGEVATLETEKTVLREEARDLWQQRRKVGPNLKEISLKTTPKWLSMWIKSHRDYRPDSKMPAFRWVDEQWKDVAAFVWQAGFTVEEFPEVALESQPRGNGARGKEIFENVGCLSCHAMGEGEDRIGGDYAANLSNLGEKLDYEWLIRWLDHPRERLVPYYPAENRDLPASEWQNRDDIDPDDLVWSMFNVMPSFRLNEQEKRDVATYLLSQQGSGAEYVEAPWVTDAERFEVGRELTKHFGCAGCHEIRGLENENKIGIELTTWGSRARDLLDFGHYTIDAERGMDPLADWRAPDDPEHPIEEPLFQNDRKWFNHLGFEKHKLAKPDLYDEGRNLYDPETGEGNPLALSRMPNFGLTDRDIMDLASFVIGSVDTASRLPDSFKYTPEGRKKAIQEGWWVVKKYNCQGCHQIVPGEVPLVADVFEKLNGEKPTLEQLPPSLVGTGFRSQPDWLAKFLHDPSLGGGEEDPQAVRPFYEWRMPSFSMSDIEVRKLVAFFDAMAAQPTGYEAPEFVPLSPEERAVADAIFKDANCQQCHVLEGQPITSEHKAPNLFWAHERLRPEWMHRWIRAPSEMQAGTAMTTLFRQNDEGTWEYINQDPAPIKAYTEDEVALMVRYVRSLGLIRDE